MTTKRITFGETIPGLQIDGKDAPYPVLNERDARAAAGLMLVAGTIAFVPAFLLGNRAILSLVVVIFFVEFAVRVFLSPRLAPFYALGRFVVSRQRPDYSGAAQKRFAWSLGLGLTAVMMVVLFILGMTGPVPLTICGVCLLLLWLETSFGICIGCLMYQGLIGAGIVRRPEIMPACPGGACDLERR
ncbi:MAG: DUF4395 domain-containing protein [Puniceicoccaceae bacterium]|nr:MAG: DUF4395 domain-containing protein [Puniceicoccaceae bacterium]